MSINKSVMVTVCDRYYSVKVLTSLLLVFYCATTAVTAQGVRIVQPNGGEEFTIGEKIDIRWEGVEEEIPIRLDYSLNGGLNWQLIAGAVTGGEYQWNAPEIVGTNFLVRALVNKVRSGDLTEEPYRTFAGHEGGVYVAEISPDGATLVTAGADKNVIVWDIESGQQIRTLTGHRDTVTGAAFHPGGTRLATSSLDSSTVMWDIIAGQKLLPVNGLGGSVHDVAFRSNGWMIATANDNGTVTVWDALLYVPIRTIQAHTAPVLAVDFGCNGDCIATGGADTTAALFDRASGDEQNRINNSGSAVTDVEIGAGDTMLYTANMDGNITYYHAETGEITGTIGVGADFLRKIQISETGNLLMALGSMGMVAFADAGTASILAAINPGKGAALGGSFGRGDELAAVGFANGEAAVWDVYQRDESDATWSIVQGDTTAVAREGPEWWESIPMNLE